MASHLCSRCSAEESLFAGEESGRLAERLAIPFIGRVPFDPLLSRYADQGMPVVLSHPGSPAAKALSEIAAKVGETLRLLPALVEARDNR
jgi:ATP-binding protein involved in chromosome partitioning